MEVPPARTTFDRAGSSRTTSIIRALSLSSPFSACATSSVLLVYLLYTSCVHLNQLLCVRVQAKGKRKKKAVGKGGAAAACRSDDDAVDDDAV